MPQRRYLFILALMFLLGLLLRVALWRDQGAAGMIFPGDQDEYYRGAIHLVLRGDYYDEGQWLRPPLTSLFFAAAFALFGINLPLALLLQCALSAAQPLLLAALARRLFRSHRAGVLAALGGACFLPFASYGSQLLSETLFTFCITLALLVLEIARQKAVGSRQSAAIVWLSSFVFRLSSFWWLAGGAAWGLAALARPVGLYALPLLMFWAAWEGRETRDARLATDHRPPTTNHRLWLSSFVFRQQGAFRLLPSACLLLGFCFVVGPWTARNYAVYHQLVVVDTNGGVSFWLGNLLTPEERDLQQVWNRTLPNSALRQGAALDRARANIMQEPLLFLARMRYKTVSLWQLDLRLFAANDTRGPTLDESSLPFAAISDMQYVLLVLAALLGAFMARPDQRNWAVLAWPVYGTLLSAVTLGHPRLRVPLLVTAMVYAALPLAHPWRAWAWLRGASGGMRGRWGLAGAATVFGLLLYSSALVPLLRGQAWLALAPIISNESAARRAVDANPTGYLPYLALGDALRERSNNVSARAAYDLAAVRDPHNALVQARRIDLLRAAGDKVAAAAALSQIAQVGWDNPQLYAWAWTALPDRGSAQLDLAAPATGLIDGVYAAERDDTTLFRWTLGRARLHLFLPAAEELRLRLRAPQANTSVEVFYEGLPIGTLTVNTTWQTYTLPIRESNSARDFATSGREEDLGVVELRIPTHIASVDDPYPKGVALAEAVLLSSTEPR